MSTSKAKEIPAPFGFFWSFFAALLLSSLFVKEDPKYNLFGILIYQWFLIAAVLFFTLFLISYGIQVAARRKALSSK